MVKTLLSFYILSYGIIPGALATLFVPLSVEEKVKDSDAVILGVVMSSHFKKSKGRIITAITLDIQKSVGLQFNQMVSKKNFKVYYPGGEWEGLIRKIEGAPRFEIGEEVILLLRHRKGAFWIHYLASGKFSKIIRNGQEFLISPVFSDEMGVGLIPFSDFQRILEEGHLQGPLSYVPSEKAAVIAQKNKRGSRNLATDNGPIYPKVGNDLNGQTFNFAFLIFILALAALAGSLYVFIINYQGHK